MLGFKEVLTDLYICYFDLFRFILQYDLPENTIK